MSIITNFRAAKLHMLKERLLAYLAAEQAILSGQEYEIEGLSLTRADLKVVRDTIADLEYQIDKYEEALQTGKNKRFRFRHVIPKDSY